MREIREGKAWNGNTSSSGIPDYLNRQFESRDLTGIIKYGIGQLLFAGLSDHLVREITGASDDLIKGSVSKEDSYLIKRTWGKDYDRESEH